jgi:hypothetical protein
MNMSKFNLRIPRLVAGRSYKTLMHHAGRQVRELQALADAAVPVSPVIPPASFGSTRQRLRKWQQEYEEYTRATAAIEKAKKVSLYTLFPVEFGSGRKVSMDRLEEEKTSDVEEDDTLSFDGFGYADYTMRRAQVPIGSLVEVR